MVVIKRDGREEPYDKSKVFNAVRKAVARAFNYKYSTIFQEMPGLIANKLTARYRKRGRPVTAEEIEWDIEVELMKAEAYMVAKVFIIRAYERDVARKRGKSTKSRGKDLDTIILYSTGCPKCLVLEKKLNEKRVAYQICNSVEEMISLKIFQAPTLSINGELMNFTDAIGWVESLPEKGRKKNAD